MNSIVTYINTTTPNGTQWTHYQKKNFVALITNKETINCSIGFPSESFYYSLH